MEINNACITIHGLGTMRCTQAVYTQLSTLITLVGKFCPLRHDRHMVSVMTN